MPSRTTTLVYVAVLFIIAGSVILFLGQSFPLSPIITLSIGVSCFIAGIVTTILALYFHQQDQV
ncbi:MAG: hypothetical protein ACFE89_09875 [Candidatus Hodarchaeota archaeon]